MTVNYARFAAAAYDDATHINALILEGWHMLPSMRKACLWTRGGEVVIAFRGTRLTDGEDLTDDAALTLGHEEARARFQQSQSWVRGVMHRFPHARITITGHSLGGSIALSCAYLNPKARIHTYEAFVSPAMISNAQTAISNYNNVTLHIVIEDPITSTSLMLVGPTFDIRYVAQGLDPHSISNWL